MSSETKVSYNEFLQQYKELTEWLGNIRLIARQQAASRSENYLTHVSVFHYVSDFFAECHSGFFYNYLV